MSELSLIARVEEPGEVHNLFPSLLQLRRCDAESIFETVEAFLIRENLEITNEIFRHGWLLHNGRDLSWCSILF